MLTRALRKTRRWPRSGVLNFKTSQGLISAIPIPDSRATLGRSASRQSECQEFAKCRHKDPMDGRGEFLRSGHPERGLRPGIFDSLRTSCSSASWPAVVASIVRFLDCRQAADDTFQRFSTSERQKASNPVGG
jgi:hypothetical protein